MSEKPIGHTLPQGYTPVLDLLHTQRAIKTLKDCFEQQLSARLDLTRVSAPLFVRGDTGLNDDLTGVERKVAFDMKEAPGQALEVVQSLAKWKRFALGRYGYTPGKGIYTDMNAIRRDEVTDNLHSIYVDQWDWERVMLAEQRNMAYLCETVSRIHAAVLEAETVLHSRFRVLKPRLPEEIAFITTNELESRYPDLTPAQREYRAAKEYGAVFISQIGWPLPSGKPHDGRAPDYDDWALNGDMIYYHEVLDCAIEISSMGIRVDQVALRTQLAAAHCEDRAERAFHSMVLSGELPLSIGGGIGQSRLCMLLLRKAHVGEVQCSTWPEGLVERMQAQGVMLL